MITNKSRLSLPTFLMLGGALTLPMLDVGFQLTKNYGLLTALGSILLGNIILTCLAFPIARIAIATGLNTVDLATRVFGNKNGRYFFSIIMATLMTGWFAIQLDVISINLNLIVSQYANLYVSPIFFNIIFGVLNIFLVLYGITNLNFLLKTLLIPITLVLLLSIKMPSAIHGNFPFHFPGLSIIIAAIFGLVIDLPTYLCMVPSWKRAKRILLVTFLIGIPCVEIIGALYASTNQALTLHDYLFTGNTWGTLGIMMCLIIGCFMANIGNNYSASVCLNAFIPKSSFKTCVIITGMLGILVACVGDTSQSMYTLIETMGIVMASISVGTISWWLAGPPSQYTLIAWFLGMGIGFGSLASLWVITTYAMLDAAIVSGIVYCVVNTLSRWYVTDYQR